jgi:hypothetical protein
VVDTAFRLRRRKLWRDTVGSPTTAYPDRYSADPASGAFVRHLDSWYAQAHPAEDFAETFAVWLAPRSGWRRRHTGTPALMKLEAMDHLMSSIRGRTPPVRSAHRIEPVAANDMTLREHYRRALQRRMQCDFTLVDRALGRGFSSALPAGQRAAGRRRAETCLRRMRSALVRHAVSRTPIDDYGARQLVQLAIERCHERQLWLLGPVRQQRAAAEKMVRRLVRASLRDGRIGFTL